MTPHEQAIEELCNCKELLRSLPKGEAWEQIHAQIDDIDTAIAALRSEPSGSLIEAAEQALDWMFHAEGCPMGPCRCGRTKRWKALRDAVAASRSTPAVPSVEEIINAGQELYDASFWYAENNAAPAFIELGTAFKKWNDVARLTQAQLSGNSGGLGRSGTEEVPSLPSGVPSPETGGPPDGALQAANAPAHRPGDLLKFDVYGCAVTGTYVGMDGNAIVIVTETDPVIKRGEEQTINKAFLIPNATNTRKP